MHQDARLKHIAELGLPPFQVAVMLALNKYANHKTHKCNPSHATIARIAVMGRSTVIRTLKELERQGHVFIKSGLKHRVSTVYTLLPRVLLASTTRKHAASTRAGQEPTTTTAMPQERQESPFRTSKPLQRVPASTKALFQVLDANPNVLDFPRKAKAEAQ